MKKVVSYLLLVCLLFITLTGCGKNNNNNNNRNNNNNGGSNAVTMSESYTKYTEAKSKMLEKITEGMNDDNYNFTVAMAMLGPALVDLALLPATVCGLSETSGKAGLSFFIQDVDYKLEGNKCTFTYKTDENKDARFIVDYDPGTDSARMEGYEDNILTLVSEYIKIGNGYASLYFMNDDEGSNDVYKIFFTEADVAIGIFKDKNQPTSIYKNAIGLDENWTKNNEFWASVKDGKLTTITDGKEQTY